MNKTTSNPIQCPKCGAPVTGDAVGGLCPRCLMAMNLATQTDVPGETGSHGTKAVPPPPAPAEIAALFPQLEILECLGRGGMGVVYKARQPKLNRFVALKLLAPEKGADVKFAERFVREAQALARLSHQNIVTVYDFGEVGQASSLSPAERHDQATMTGRMPVPLCYLVMEFVDGLSLRQMLESRRLTPEEALAIVPRICEALQYAHDQGIVHRDIKPENVLLDKQGRVKIADFGIAKLLGVEGPRPPLTEERSVIGTPHYMAPEQIERPLQVDHRADIYSLGVVFYEMLTGELPLGKFALPSTKVQVDVRLDDVVLHTLEKEPSRRYQHASEVKTDVETIAHTQGAIPSSSPPIARGESSSPLADVCRQVRGPAVGLVVTGILNWLAIPLIFLVILYASSRREADSNWLILVPLSALVLSSAMLIAGLKMKRLEAYSLAITGSILAILVCPGNLIGLPIGIWALVVLSRREVREAFGKGLPLPRLEPASSNRGGGGWKVAAVIAAAVMLLLAIPISVLLLAIVIPNLARAPHAQAASLVVSGTVSDATTGEPIAGARVADHLYAGRPNRPSQECWSDAIGHFALKTWAEEHTLVVSAPGYETRLATLLTSFLGREREARMDFELQPTDSVGPAFSPVQEMTLHDCDVQPEALDFETGRVLIVPEEARQQLPTNNMAWFMNSGADLLTDTTPKGVGLITTRSNELKLVKLANEEWDTLTRAQLSAMLAQGVSGLAEDQARDFGKVYFFSTNTPVPVTLAFRTGSRSEGVLQLTRFGEGDQPPVTLRYKMVNQASAMVTTGQPATNDLLLVIHDNAGLDLDTGAVRPVQRGTDTNVLAALDIGWDNDGGGALMKNPLGAARILALPDVQNFGEAVVQAMNRASLLRNSEARGSLGRQCRFFAVLTDRGNLAAVEVIDPSEKQASIRWRLLSTPKP